MAQPGQGGFEASDRLWIAGLVFLGQLPCDGAEQGDCARLLLIAGPFSAWRRHSMQHLGAFVAQADGTVWGGGQFQAVGSIPPAQAAGRFGGRFPAAGRSRRQGSMSGVHARVAHPRRSPPGRSCTRTVGAPRPQTEQADTWEAGGAGEGAPEADAPNWRSMISAHRSRQLAQMLLPWRVTASIW